MTSIQQFLSHLHQLGIRFWIEEGRLHYRARAAVTAELRAAMSARRDEILAFLHAAAASGEVAPAIVRRSSDVGRLPLSFAQQRLWFLTETGSGARYHVPLLFRLRGPLDIAALGRAFDEVVRRHESLRTVFASRDGEAEQVVQPAAPLPLPLVDIAAAADVDVALERQLGDEAERPFDLSRAWPLRARLLRCDRAGRDHVLAITLHHIVADGWSVDLLVRELSGLYAAFRAGTPALLPELPIQYADYALWQRRQAARDDGHLDYWRRQLAGAAPILALPSDRPRPPVQSGAGAELRFTVDGAVAARLAQRAEAAGATPFMALAAAFALLLSRWSGSLDVLISTPSASRPRPELEPLIGFFVNALVLRVDLGGNPSFDELLARVHATTLDAYAHEALPFDRLVAELQPERSPSHAPIAQVGLALQRGAAAELTLPGVVVTPLEPEVRHARRDLELYLVDGGAAGLDGRWVYSTDLYAAATIERLTGWWHALLAGIAADPGRRIGDLPLLSEAERREVAMARGTTFTELPAGPLHHRFEAHAARTPDAPAVVCDDGERVTTLSYAELNRRANALAHRLLAAGLGAESLVGLFVERTPRLAVAMLAVLKAGAAYLPLDDAYPAARLAHILGDARPALVLTEPNLAARLPNGVVAWWLDDDQGPDHGHDIEGNSGRDDGRDNPRVAVDPDALAYVIYTSGSTGRPKGVLLHHRGLHNLVATQCRMLELSAADRVLHFASLGFDAATSELWLALYMGATLCLGTRAALAPGAPLAAFLARQRVSAATLTPSTLAATPAAALPELRTLAFVGEPCPAELVRRWAAPTRRLWNLYGPTEATINATAARCIDVTVPPPIGRPLAHTSAYVLDRYGNLAPTGVPGELCLGGAGIARGYLGAPALTAERFVPNPFGPGRLYRTGDRARLRSDGNLEFLGRLDEQVKVNGCRIEPGEIEAALGRDARVREAVVMLREDHAGEPRLTAYVVRRGKADATALRQQLATELPAYMIPAHFVFLDSLPLNDSGKVDRRALPVPEAARADGAEAGDEGGEPAGATERLVARVWQEVLGADRVGRDEDFFALGGDSILALQVVAQAATAGLRVSADDLFAYPTVRRLAAVATSTTAAISEPNTTAITAPNTAAISSNMTAISEPNTQAALTPIQHWFLHYGSPEPHHFNQAFLLELDSELPHAQIAAALEAIHVRHDAFRLRFTRAAAGWAATLSATPAPLTLHALDVSDAVDAADGEARIAAQATRLQAAIDLERGPLWVAALFTRGAGQRRWLLLAVHHLAIDGVSWRILVDELGQALAQLGAGRPLALPPKSTSFAAWARHLADYARSPAATAQLAYWRAIVGAESAALAPDYARGPNDVASARTLTTRLDAAATRRLLRDAPAAHGATTHELLLAALAATWSRTLTAPALRIDVDAHGRDREVAGALDLSRTVGWCTAVHPFLLPLGDASLAARLAGIHAELARLPAGGVAYGALRYLAGDAAQAAALTPRLPADLCFNYLGQFDGALAERALLRALDANCGETESPRATRQHAFDVSALVLGHQLHIHWTYSENLYRRETVAAHAAAFAAALGHIIGA